MTHLEIRYIGGYNVHIVGEPKRRAVPSDMPEGVNVIMPMV